MIGLNDFRLQWSDVRGDALAAFERVGQSGWLVLGSEVRSFEIELAKRFGVSHAIGCGNGLDALDIALRCAGIRADDLVVTTPLSAFATSLAIARLGAIPVFVDVDASGLIDLTQAEQALAETGARFLLPVHLYGHSVDLDRLDELAKRFGVVVIEDAAQAIDAGFRARPVGSVGRLTATSFYPTKNLGAFGDGGAVLTNDPDLASRARALRDYGQTARYVHEELGLNSRLDEIQAALMRSAMLPRLEGWTARRREIAQRYRSGLTSSYVTLPPVTSDSASVWHLFPVLVHGDREAFLEHLRVRGVNAGVHYPVLIPDQKALAARGNRVFSPLIRAREFAEHEVSLPIHPYLTNQAVAHVIDACNEWSGAS